MDDLTVGGLINGTGIESTSHREGRITLPARGEFRGKLEAPPLRFKVR